MPGLGQSDLLSMGQQFSGLPMDSLIGGPLNAAAAANGAMAMNQVRFMLDTCFHQVKVKAIKKEAEIPGTPEIPESKDKAGNIIPAVAAKPGTPAIAAQEEQTNYNPIMINMSLTRQVITPATADGSMPTQIQPLETTFSLPLLTIIPLNSLAVQSVDIGFEMEVKSSYGEDHSNESSKKMAGEASFEAKVGFGCFSATVKGSASYASEDKTSENSHYEKSNSAKYTVNVKAGQLPLPGGVKTIIDAFAGAIQPITLPVPEK